MHSTTIIDALVSRRIESKFFVCETCGQISLQLIFIPEATSPTLLRLSAETLLNLYEESPFEVWLIGAPDRSYDEDSTHHTMQVWPTLGPAQLITPPLFNAYIVRWETRHCSEPSSTILREKTKRAARQQTSTKLEVRQAKKKTKNNTR